jgi:hypothetical protein
MSNYNKNVNVQWYGNLNKLILLGVIISIPIIGFGIYLWSRYLAARIIVWVVAGLVGLGLFIILIKWLMKITGIKFPRRHHQYHKENHIHKHHHDKPKHHQKHFKHKHY